MGSSLFQMSPFEKSQSPLDTNRSTSGGPDLIKSIDMAEVQLAN